MPQANGPTKAQQAGMTASMQWWSDSRELTVSFNQRELEASIIAWVKLNGRDAISNSEPSVDLYRKIMAEAFLSLYDSETVNPIHPVTDLGQAVIDGMRRETGIGLDALPAPAAPQLSADYKLRQEIIKDWNTLPGDKVRAKAAADKNYFRILNELLEGDGIPAPGSTSFYQIAGPDFGSQNKY